MSYRSLGAANLSFEADMSPPSQYHFPSEADYTKALAGSVKYLTDWGKEALTDALNLPTNTSLHGIQAIVESTAGASLGQIVAGQMIPSAPADVTNMMSTVLDGAVNVAVSGLSKALGDTLGDVLDVIPMVGAFAGYIVDIITMMAQGGTEITPQEESAATQQAFERFESCLREKCGYEAGLCRDVRPTGWRNGQVVATAADTFRPFAYALSSVHYARNGAVALPWCGAMPFAMLCGGETRGVIWKDRAEYNLFMSQMRQKYNDPELGMPEEAQRRMWSLFLALCQCVNDPRPGVVSAQKGDGGRSLFPLMMDLAYSHNVQNRWRSPNLHGHWTVDLLKEMSAYHAPACSASGSEGGASTIVTGNCVNPGGADIIGGWSQQNGFMQLFSDYEIYLVNNFMKSDGSLSPYLTSASAKSSLRTIPKRAVLTLSTRTVNKLLAERSSSSIGKTVAGLVATAATGYTAWTLTRALAKGRRR